MTANNKNNTTNYDDDDDSTDDEVDSEDISDNEHDDVEDDDDGDELMNEQVHEDEEEDGNDDDDDDDDDNSSSDDDEEEDPVEMNNKASNNEKEKNTEHDQVATTATKVVHQQQQQQHNVSTVLSKSWKIQSIYQPIYTGGKCTVLTLSSIPSSSSISSSLSSSNRSRNVLVSQVFGNVCFINLYNHQQITSIQDYDNNYGGVDNNNNEIDDDNDKNNKYDRNAITSFAIAPASLSSSSTSKSKSISSLKNSSSEAVTKTSTTTMSTPQSDDDDDDCFYYTLVTCTQNNTMRIYTVQIQCNSKGHKKDNSSNTKRVQSVIDDNNNNDDDDDDDDRHTTDIQDDPNAITVAAEIQITIQLQSTTTYIGHTLPVTSMEFHSSNIFLATASVDSTVRIWDVRNCCIIMKNNVSTQQQTKLSINTPSQKPYITHIFRPQQQQSTTSSSSSSSNSMLAVTCISWIPSIYQLLLAIGRDDGSITIHNLRDNVTTNDDVKSNKKKNSSNLQHQQQNLISVLHDHISAVTSIVWNIDNNLLITSGRDSVIHLWKYTSNSNKANPKQIITTTKAVSSTITSYTRVYTVPIYEQVEGMVVIKQHDQSSTLFSIATVGTKGQIRCWDITTINSIKYEIIPSIYIRSTISNFGEKRGGYTGIQSVFIPYGTTTVTTSNDNTMQQQQYVITDAEQNITFCSLQKQQDPRIEELFLRADRTIVGFNDEILDLKVLPRPIQQQLLTDNTKISTTSSTSEQMVVVTNSNQIRLYDVNTLSCNVVYDEYHTSTILGVDISPCGRYIATCSKDHTVRLWTTFELNSSNDSATVATKCIAVGVGHTDAIGSVALSRKVNLYDVSGKAAINGAGAFCVTVSVDRTIKRWNLPGTSALHTEAQVTDKGSIIQLITFSSAHAHDKDINIVAIAPNDSIIATGSQDKTVKLFKSSNLSLITTLKGHRRGVWDVCFSSYDRIVATGSGDKTIKLWSLNDYSCVRTFQGHLASVLRVRFLSGGLQLLSSGADGLIKLWTVRTNETEATLDAHTDRIWALDLTMDRKRIISGGADSQIIIWKDTTKEMDDAKLAVEEEAILIDQKLANHLRRKEYGEALKISLERDKPHHTLKVLNAMIEVDLRNGLTGVASIQSYVKGWNNEQVIRILRYCREWNTRARNSHVAMLTIKAITTSIPVQTLAAMQGVPEIVAGIIPYMERHFERLDRLHANSYLFDFALSSMGVMDRLKDKTVNEYDDWEAKSKLVLPPRTFDGRIDVGGNVIVGAPMTMNRDSKADTDSAFDDEQSNEIVTMSESEDSSDK